MRVAVLFLLMTCVGCREAKPAVRSFCGTAMTIPYHIQVGPGPRSDDEVQSAIAGTFEEIDARFNKWNPDSELSKLNHWDKDEPFPCSPELLDMLRTCEKIVSSTRGTFDPTVEPLEQVWKKALEAGSVPTEEQLAAIRPALGWKRIRLLNNGILKEHPSVALDLGGIAKGHAVDLLVERLAAIGFQSIYVEWGGEIRTQGSHPDGRPWKIGIRHPRRSDKVLEVVECTNGALATSGDYLQYWTVIVNGEPMQFYHVFDIQTQRPLESTQNSLVSVTIQHESCCLADGLTKALLCAKDKEEARALFEERVHPLFPTTKVWLFSHEDVAS